MLSADSKDVVKEYEVLLNELKKYNPELIDKQRLIAISKSDLINEKDIEKIKNKVSSGIKNIPFEFISSVSNKGLIELKDKMWKVLNEDL